jgi:hypothetical protein
VMRWRPEPLRPKFRQLADSGLGPTEGKSANWQNWTFDHAFITSTEADCRARITPSERPSTSSMSAQHQRLDRQHQRLNSQQHRVHNSGRIDDMQPEALEPTEFP